ncbi:hypothetical protein HG535_0H02790 [Zygotorulaspora mrakii]|uniref:Autophagy-related protein 21 n=1 Tax=Zygotorulaspora mrakii TaxID=42260 RepID=A0A7H9BB24_ZYGMR|nr:uncharacterized protein HG535_0H02790 [Zygotorulaspora mrakii]QLG74952.1 hypothetical protein HG535_0H02790 [Zygotorulaspora mrakii]
MKALRFNQDATCCVVNPEPHLVSIYNCDPFGKCFELDGRGKNQSIDNLAQYPVGISSSSFDGENEYVIEMLFSTSLVAIADRSQGTSNSKKLKIINTKRKCTICEVSFPHGIVDVVMNRKRMCILLESDQIFVYDISCMKPLETIDLWEDHFKKTSSDSNEPKKAKSQVTDSRSRTNSVGSSTRPRMALSSDDRSILCFTSYSSSKNNSSSYLLNDIVIYDTLNVAPINYMNTAHKGNIACMAISNDGKTIATASDKGTIVRVFNTGVDTEYDSRKPLLYEFRRGTRPCNLYYLCFNRKASLLGCVGNTDTIHIFSLKEDIGNYDAINSEFYDEEEDLSQSNNGNGLRDRKSPTDTSNHFTKFISRGIKATIPKQNLRRDYAHIPVLLGTTYCLGFPDEFVNQVYLAGDDGKFLVYSLPSTPGECVLTKSNTFI